MIQVANPIYTKLCHDMNVEDEYFSAIEKRDTEILMRDKKLADLQTLNDEQKSQLDEQKSQLDEQKRIIATSVKMLLSAGMPEEVICQNLNVSMDFVNLCKE
ncbi:MAG: hypothetical protein KBT06_05040 [Prevotellaceae bacterium]|nr:hypothetical protein [Candidatus Colivivens equi]